MDAQCRASMVAALRMAARAEAAREVKKTTTTPGRARAYKRE